MLSSLDKAFDKLKKAKEAEEEAKLLGIEGMEHQAYRELLSMADYLGDFPAGAKIPENQVAKCQSNRLRDRDNQGWEDVLQRDFGCRLCTGRACHTCKCHE